MSDHTELVEQAREREDLVGLGMLDLVDAVRRRDELVAGLADAVEKLSRGRDGIRDKWLVAVRQLDEARARVADLEDANRRLRRMLAEVKERSGVEPDPMGGYRALDGSEGEEDEPEFIYPEVGQHFPEEDVDE